MNFIQTGIRELGRKVGRQRLHAIIWLRDRSLHHAEVELGWLGWEQADFHDPEMEAEVARIQNFEKEQAQLVNASAELAEKVREVEEQRAAAKKTLEETIKRLETERAPLEAERTGAAASLRTKREARGRFARNAEDFPRLQAALQARYDDLSLIEPKTPEMRTDLARLREERARAERELREIQGSHARIGEEITALEQSIAQLDQQLGVFYAAERDARAKHEKTDAEYLEQIREAEEERLRTAKAVTELDSKKTDPYRRLGQCLADNNIPPRNQPDALLHVHELREQIAAAEQGIAQLLAESAAEDPAELTKFYVFLAVVLIAILILLLAAMHHA